MKIKQLIAAFLSATVLATSVAPVFAVPSAIETGSSVGVATLAADPVTITVDPSKDSEAASNTYKTIREAVAAAKAINPQSEEARVTINVNPGVYEEQVRIDGMKFLTLQQTPGTEGTVTITWYFCTGYCTSNTDLTGLYDPTIDWSRDETWNGYKEGDEKFTRYEIGQDISNVDKISYYDINGVAHKDVPRNSMLSRLGGLGWSYDKMAPLIITRTSSDITVKDVNLVNSVPVMKIAAEESGHLTPEIGSTLPDHNALSICSEDTVMIKPDADIYDESGKVNLDKYKAVVAAGRTFNPGESAWLLRSSAFNERGHALATLGDRIVLENIRVRGNQDSVWASDGRAYFKNCTLIGGTDYIYGSASAVFDNCKLGLASFTDYAYGNPLSTPNTDQSRKYGYLFWNCTLFNMVENSGVHNFGGPWGAAGQATYYNTTIDDKAEIGASKVAIDPKGWGRFGAENGLGRLYEYGTKNLSGADVDLSKRVVNKSVEEGGTGMGTVLDEWQILEFNPRNYFSKDRNDSTWADNWDPMNFAAQLASVDTAMANATVNIPSNEDTTFALPEAPDGIAFKWESASTNAIVSEDGKNVTVIRPAAGESNIETEVVLYAMDTTTKLGDKKEIPVIITPTTNTADVFSIPVTVNTSTSLDTDSTYDVTISKNGAVVKKYTVKMPAGQTTVTETIENIPANADGIDYDVTVHSSSDEMTITAPVDCKTTVKGITGESVALTITALKVVDKTVNLDITTEAKDGNKTFDLIALAKEKGASDSVATSDIISVEFDVDAAAKPSVDGFIDISSGTPSNKNSAVAERFTVVKVNQSWTQLDTVDNSQGFSGASDTPGQCLNITGKFDYSTTHHVKATINYKEKTVTIDGNNAGDYKNSATPYTFESFPETAEKGKFVMGVFPGSTSDDYKISNVQVTYKEVVSSGGSDPLPTTAPADPTEEPTATPEPTEVPTPAPVDPAIKEAKVEGGNTVVTLEGITSGVVIAAKFDGKVLKDIKSAAVSGDIVTINEIEATTVYVWDNMETAEPLCDSYVIKSSVVPTPVIKEHTADFTTMSAVPVYSAEVGYGFVSKSSAIRAEGYEREVADPSTITISADGAKVTESNGAYLYKKTNNLDGDDFNNGGLIYRVDTGAPGAYKIEVEVADAKTTTVAPTGMQADRLTSTSNWDNAGEIARTVYATWTDNVWTYDFATGENFVEIEIEPKTLATADAPQTVGVKSIKVTPLAVNPAGDKPTIHILGDSTQKTYTFNEQISAWGQTLVNYFNPDKVNVINYSMGGRAMKSNYNEGRANEPLIRGKEGDFVFIHSAHNDETVSTNRFSRGSGVSSLLAANNASYNRWLDMYVEMIKARGMTPVLVTGMPRTGGGKYSESADKPNGFNPDSPANMRAKAAADSEVGLVELYAGAKAYFDKLDATEVMYIYNNYEAGETPANNYANGGTSDGTHYREGASKQFNRIMLQSIYDQSVATNDTYTDKAIMAELVTYMKDEVQNGVKTGDWSAVFPEMASDVSAVDVVPGATKQAKDNYYYRNNIEKALQLGLLSKDKNNLFKPTDAVTVGEFARSVEKVFGLEANSLTSYTKTAAELGVTATASENAVLSSDDATLADGEVTVTIAQAEGGEITVYNESAFNTETTDITDTVVADAVLADNDFYTLTAPSEIVNKTDKNGLFTNKEITTAHVEVRNNGTKQIKYTAKQDGIFTAYLMFVDHKLITMENKTDGKKITKYINNTEIAGTTQANQYSEVTFNVEAGKEYEFYTNGGTGRLFGIKYESTNYPQSKESLVVNSGDTVRVTAYANTSYVNGSILVNGEETAVGKKEYTFVVTGPTTVTATFIAEPGLVETTVIPSDAALTREAMAAIIYDAYQIANTNNPDGNWHIYFGQNGGVPSPDDPNYDPNIKYEGQPYIPLTGWGALTDKSELSDDLFAKVKAVYNLGMIRSEQGIARGSVACGNVLEPKTVVTRAKAAKALVFMYILTQPTGKANQYVPAGCTVNVVDSIAVPTEGIAATPVVE